jgi:hypothetical protein
MTLRTKAYSIEPVKAPPLPSLDHPLHDDDLPRCLDELVRSGCAVFTLGPDTSFTLTDRGIKLLFGPQWGNIELLAHLIYGGRVLINFGDGGSRLEILLAEEKRDDTLSQIAFGAFPYDEGFAREWGNA